MPRTLVLALTLIAVAGRLSAQSDTAARLPRHLCWRGKPLPECRTFWITEFGIDATMSSTRTNNTVDYGGGNVDRFVTRDFDSRFVWTVGPMFNTGPRSAFGGTVSVSPSNSHARVAVEVRRRHWANEDLAFDFSAGGLRASVAPTTGFQTTDQYGLTAGALVTGADLIEINGRVDLLVTGGRARLGTSIGLGGGSYVAVIGTVALGLLVLAVISAGPWD